MTSARAQHTLCQLWQEAGLPPEALEQLVLTGADPVLPSSFAVGSAAQFSIAAAALAAAEFHAARGAPRQVVRVSMQDAALEFRSERLLRVPVGSATEIWDKIAGVYQSGDQRWLRLHTNFPHHRDGVLELLQCAYDRHDVARALSAWSAEEFEQAASDRGLCVAMARTFDEWDRHPQGRAVAAAPLYEMDPIGPAAPRQSPCATRPLEGIRVLDLTRIIAGPVCSRTLSAHGAEVLHVTSPNLPSILPLVIDTGRGKRSCFIDLKTATGIARIKELLREADVFVQGYRPGSLAALGLGPEQLAQIKPGIVCVSLSAYGPNGPWSKKRGFDSLVQMASGLNCAEACTADGADDALREPKALPAQALDHAAGYLMAFATMATLARQMKEGQSWHIQVSLARAGHWIRDLGRVPQGLSCPEPDALAIEGCLVDLASGFGPIKAVRHAAHMQHTPPRWERPSVPLGTDPPAWAARE